MRSRNLLLLLLIPTLSLADEIVRHSYPKSSQPDLVLTIPDEEIDRSTWNPIEAKLPLSPDAALKAVFRSEIIRGSAKQFRVTDFHLWARHASLSSDLSAPFMKHGETPVLRTFYLITMTRLSDGRSYPFGVLLDGTVFSPTEDKKH